MIPFSGGRNLPDRAARDSHVCLSVRNVDCGRFRRYCKSSGRKVRAACIRLTSSLSDVPSDIRHFMKKRIEVQFPVTRARALPLLSIMPDAKFSDLVLVNFPSFAPRETLLRLRAIHVSYRNARDFGKTFLPSTKLEGEGKRRVEGEEDRREMNFL